MKNKYQSLSFQNVTQSNNLNQNISSHHQLKPNQTQSNTYISNRDKISNGVLISSKPYFLEYEYKNPLQSSALSSENQTKTQISITTKQVDPLEPSKFKHRRIQKESNEAPVTILRSPQKKVSAEEMRSLKIPPCLSNYSNQKGYTIPLHMRVMGDMRKNNELIVNENFNKLSDVLGLIEKESKRELEERAKAKDALRILNNIKQEQELIRAAEEARRRKFEFSNVSTRLSRTSKSENVSLNDVKSIKTEGTNEEMLLRKRRRKEEDEEDEEENEIKERNRLREILKKEIITKKRERIEGKREVGERKEYGNISNKIKENELIDAKMYNQTSGIECGFKDDEDYDLYDKPLFKERSIGFIGRDEERREKKRIEFEKKNTN